MSSSTTRGSRRGSKTTTHEQRIAIIILRNYNNLSFPQISSQISVNPNRCGKIYRQVKNQTRCENPTLAQLLEAAQPLPKTRGRPTKVLNRSSLSRELRAAIINLRHAKPIDAIAHVLHQYGITLSYHTVNNIMRNHRNEQHPYAIVRGSELDKPPLDEEALSSRRNYSNWLIREFNLHFPKLVFVCYDESSKSIRGSNPHKHCISRPRGADPYTYARPARPPKFTLMICAATSSDTHCKMERPCVI